MTIHKLKTDPKFWHEVYHNRKTFEVRRNDRGFKVGDDLVLIRGTDLETGQGFIRRVIYILEGGQYGIEQGFCVLGLR